MTNKSYEGLIMSLFSLGGSTNFTLGQGDSLRNTLYDALEDGMVFKSPLFIEHNTGVERFKLSLTPKGKIIARQYRFIYDL